MRLQPVTNAKRIRITFNGSVSDVLPWKFVPQQREVRVLPGETALAFYTATNKSDEDIIGVATYSVTPGQVAPYFSKIQCFCFEEQRLNAGETVDMPVFFYIDPDFVNDPNMRGIEQVTLSYTFFSTLSWVVAEALMLTVSRGAVRQKWAFDSNASECMNVLYVISASIGWSLAALEERFIARAQPMRSSTQSGTSLGLSLKLFGLPLLTLGCRDRLACH